VILSHAVSAKPRYLEEAFSFVIFSHAVSAKPRLRSMYPQAQAVSSQCWVSAFSPSESVSLETKCAG
jgi:hypothetical protein